MSPDQVILAALRAFSEGDTAGCQASLTEDAVYWEPCTGRKAEGRDAVTEITSQWKASWPDLRNTDNKTITQGDEVALETVWLGTQTGPLYAPDGQTLPATNKATVNPAAMIATVRDGKVASMHHYFDLTNIMRALGLVE